MKRRGVITGLIGLAGSAAWAQPMGVTTRRPRPRPLPTPDALLRASGLAPAQMGCAAVDLATGGEGPGWQSGLLLAPASTLKTVTALYALDRLGPAHRFATRVLRAGDTLVLAGGGDPTLDTDGLAVLAADVARTAGNWRPQRFLVWGGALPRLAEIAPGQAVHLAYNPAISGMILNYNRVHLGWRCAEECSLTFETGAEAEALRAYTVTAALRLGGGGFGHALSDGAERWDVPRAGLGKSGSRWLPVRLPEAYAGDVFQTLCRAQGLVLPAAELSDLPPEGIELARRDSAPLPVILRGMLKHSTNLTAEAVGLAASGAPSLRDSAGRMASWLAGTGAGDAVLADHSGLSDDNRIAAQTLARMLALPEARQALAPLLNRDPLRDALGSAARGHGRDGAPEIAAKTGTLNFVSCLAGYATDARGAEIAFAVMLSDPEQRAGTVGDERPAGVLTWTARAKRLQQDLVENALIAIRKRDAYSL